MRDMQFNAQGRILGIKVKDGQVTARSGRGPLAGARATLETTGDVHRRVTATRLLTTGVFAFALKKKRDDRTLWLTIDGPGFQAVVEVNPKNERVARAWMAEFNTRAAQPQV
jgi:hypothetical protein